LHKRIFEYSKCNPRYPVISIINIWRGTLSPTPSSGYMTRMHGINHKLIVTTTRFINIQSVCNKVQLELVNTYRDAFPGSAGRPLQISHPAHSRAGESTWVRYASTYFVIRLYKLFKRKKTNKRINNFFLSRFSVFSKIL